MDTGADMCCESYQEGFGLLGYSRVRVHIRRPLHAPEIEGFITGGNTTRAWAATEIEALQITLGLRLQAS